MSNRTTAAAAIWGRSSEDAQRRFTLYERDPLDVLTEEDEMTADEWEAELAKDRVRSGIREFVDRNGRKLYLFSEAAVAALLFARDITGFNPYRPVYALDRPQSDGARRTAAFFYTADQKPATPPFDAYYGTLRSWEYAPQSTAYWLKDVESGQYFTVDRSERAN